MTRALLYLKDKTAHTAGLHSSPAVTLWFLNNVNCFLILALAIPLNIFLGIKHVVEDYHTLGGKTNLGTKIHRCCPTVQCIKSHLDPSPSLTFTPGKWNAMNIMISLAHSKDQNVSFKHVMLHWRIQFTNGATDGKTLILLIADTVPYFPEGFYQERYPFWF